MGNFSGKTFSWFEGSGVGSGPGLSFRSQKPGGVQDALEKEGDRAWATFSTSSLVRHLLPTFPQMLQMLNPHCRKNPGDLGVWWKLQLLGRCSSVTGIRISMHFLKGPRRQQTRWLGLPLPLPKHQLSPFSPLALPAFP